MKKFFTLALLLVSAIAQSQLLTWSPQFPTATQPSITITMNAALGNQAFVGYNGSGYMHLGVITNLSTGPSDWRYTITTWGIAIPQVATHLGGNTWIYTIKNPDSTFGVAPGETILEIALLFRSVTGDTVQRNADAGDMKVPIYTAGSNNIIFTKPVLVPENYPISNAPIYGVVGTAVSVTALAGINAPSTATTGGTLNLYFDGNLIAGPVTGTNTISGSGTPTTTGSHQFISQLTVNGASVYDTINFYIVPPTVVASLPSAVVVNSVPHEGINYYGCSDSVTLVLYAPNKTSSVLIGDFTGSNWIPQSQYQMYKTPDGNYYWITIHGLTSGTQYAFQYLVDDSLYIADPYSEEILDGANDKYIPTSTYPNLKPYPTNSNVSASKNGLIGILQTCPSTYKWAATNFTPPNNKNLVIEEVLVRDFATVDGYGNFQLLLDSLHYFKSLGINALELMPVAEFSGNDSWGYNPNFTSALDKAYGTKIMYQTFVDSCHANGIAVIMDVCFNQIDDNDIQVPEARLYWNSTTSAPSATNPWLNQAAPHPYSVFDDINHTSTASQYWVERSLNYWLTQFHIDGFRFDLAKGFTQNCTNGTNLQCPGGDNSGDPSVENYDASRVANLELYYNYVKANHPGATMPYMILEFLGTQNYANTSSEENTYANYGFMLWNDVRSNDPTSGCYTNNGSQSFPQCTMGYGTSANLWKAVYNSNEQSFTQNASLSYMTSHDDPRIMWNNENNGNGASVQSISGQGGGLQRMAAAAAVLFTIPGPHMFYQFDERGYDINDSVGGGNTAYKPPHWEYLTTDANATGRKALMAAYSKIISFRVSNPNLFNGSSFNADLYDGCGLVRMVQNSDASGTGMKFTVLANFDITAQTYGVPFQTTGTWINYISDGTGSGYNGATGSTFTVSSTSSSSNNITLQPGEYHIYVSVPSTTYVFTGNGSWQTAGNWLGGNIPPTTLPSGSQILVQPQPGGMAVLDISQTIASGATFTVFSQKTLQITGNLNIQK